VILNGVVDPTTFRRSDKDIVTVIVDGARRDAVVRRELKNALGR